MASKKQTARKQEEVEKADSSDLVVRYLEMLHAVDCVVWNLGLATYSEHKRVAEQLRETLQVPHRVLLGLAMYYLNGRLDHARREHAVGIYTLGEVISFAGQMAAAYQPDDEDTQQHREMETTSEIRRPN